jgi:DME family drug/metabolite transporter
MHQRRTLMVGGAASTWGTWGLFFTGLTRIEATRGSMLALLEPLVAVLVGAIVFGQLLGRFAYAGAALMLLCGWAALRVK